MTVLGMTYAGSVPYNPQLPVRRESTVKAQPVLRVDFGVQRRQAHDSLKFQSVDGACVFLGVPYGTVSEQCGYSFYVCALVEYSQCKAVTGAVPCYVLVDTGCFGPPFQSRLA